MKTGIKELKEFVDVFFEIAGRISIAKEDGRFSTFERIGVGLNVAKNLKNLDFGQMFEEIDDLTVDEAGELAAYIAEKTGMSSDWSEIKGFLRIMLSILKSEENAK